jgi:C4-dicarboxylate transporter DctM subunit
MIIAIAFLVMFGLLFLGLPIAFGLGIVAFGGTVYILGLSPASAMVAQIAFDTLQSYDLVVLPLFLMMGNFIARSGLAQDLFTASNAFLGHRRGGLAMATILACGGFSAVCGSSMATAATMARVSLPPMRKFAYADSLALGSIAAGGTLGILIPPSVIMLLYGIMTDTNIGKLFIAGIIPGAICILAFLATISVVTARNPDLGRPGPRQGWRERLIALRGIWGVLLLFLIVLGGIYGGVFTPTEAAGIGAFGALAFAILTRRMSFTDFREAMSDSVRTTAMMLILLVGAILFNNLMELSGFTNQLKEWIASLSINRWLVIWLIIGLYLILGCLLESLSMLLLTIPVFFPIVASLGFDPVWFGIIVVVVIEIGLISPPIGLNVFVLSAMFKDVPMSTIFRGVTPFMLAQFACLVLFVFVPDIVTILPRLMD